MPTPSGPSVPGDATALTSARYPLLLFFDGQCAFCDRWVNRIRAADQGRRLRYGTKQGATFQAVAKAHPELAQVESVVLARLRPDGGEDFLVRSAAVRETIRGLPDFGFFSGLLTVTPAPLAELGYRVFSKLRTPLFGRLASCRIPREDEKLLFVD